MQVASGTASHIRRSAEVYGNSEEVGTSQIATFRIGSQAVQLTMPAPPQIEEGDEVVVAGDLHGGTLHGRAYHNRSNGTFGRGRKQSVVLGCLLHLGLFVMGTFFLGILLSNEFGQGPRAFLYAALAAGALTGCWWLKSFLAEMKTRRALQLVCS